MGESIIHTTGPSEDPPFPSEPCSIDQPAPDLPYEPHATNKVVAATATPPPPPLAMWAREEVKLLELLFFRHFPRWDVIASCLPSNRTPEEACRRFESLLDEVTRVLKGLEVDTPREWDAPQTIAVVAATPAPEKETLALPAAAAPADVSVAASPAGEEAAPVAEEKKDLVPTSSSNADGEAPEDGAAKKKARQKPVMWTKEEHNLFLEGLEKYGKGKWKVMATEFLTTKTAIQIASHHQKHCKRLVQRKRNECKRASIHDITAPTTSSGKPAAARKEDEFERGGDGSKGVEELVGVGA